MDHPAASSTKKRRTTCTADAPGSYIKNEDVGFDDSSTLKPKMLIFGSDPHKDSHAMSMQRTGTLNRQSQPVTSTLFTKRLIGDSSQLPSMQHNCPQTRQSQPRTETPLKRRFVEDLLHSTSMQHSCPSKQRSQAIVKTKSERYLIEDWRSPRVAWSSSSELDRMVSAVASPMRNRLTFHVERDFSHEEGRTKSSKKEQFTTLAASATRLLQEEDKENILDISSDATEELSSSPSLPRPRFENFNDSDATSEASDVLSDPEGNEIASTADAAIRRNIKKQQKGLESSRTFSQSGLDESLDSSERLSNISETPTEQRDTDVSDISSDAIGEVGSPPMGCSFRTNPGANYVGEVMLKGNLPATLSRSACASTSTKEDNLKIREDQVNAKESQLQAKEEQLEVKENHFKAKEITTTTRGHQTFDSKMHDQGSTPRINDLAARVAAARRSQALERGENKMPLMPKKGVDAPVATSRNSPLLNATLLKSSLKHSVSASMEDQARALETLQTMSLPPEMVTVNDSNDDAASDATDLTDVTEAPSP